MTLSIRDIPKEELLRAPRIFVKNAAGVGVRSYDPKWIANRLREIQVEFPKTKVKSERERLDADLIRAEKEAEERFLAEMDAIHGAYEQRFVNRSNRIILDVLKAHPTVSRRLLVGPHRFVYIIDARKHAAYELRRILGWSYPQIAKKLGRADHTTAINLVEKWPARAAQLGIPVIPIEKKEAA